MQLAVFGASGRTGRLVVQQAVARGHDVAALVRRPEPSLEALARTLVVDLEDRSKVAAALDGAEAVVWAIGPIAGLTAREVSDALRVAIDAADDAGVRRIAVTANATVLTRDDVTGAYANVTAEHRRNVAALRASRLDWTVLAPPILTDDPATGAVETVVDAKAPGPSLARGDFASALLDALDRPEWIGHIVGIANASR